MSNKIMRTQILGIILLFFLNQTSYSIPTINKVWIGENLEYLSLIKKNIYFDDGNGHTENNCKLIHRDTSLIIRKYFWQAGKMGRQYEDYICEILKLTNDTLIISPKNKKATILTKNKESYIYTDKNILYKEDLQFQKLCFSKLCGFSHSNIKIDIDCFGQVYFFSESISFKKKDNNYKGSYIGQLNEKQLFDLIEILKKSELDRFPTELGNSIDAPIYNFKFYYDNKIKESVVSNIPLFYEPLLDYLLTIYKNIKIEKVGD